MQVNLSYTTLRQEDPLELSILPDRVNNRTAEDIQQMAKRVFEEDRIGSLILISIMET